MPKPLLIRISIAALAPMLIIVPQARADAEDTINLTAGISVLHDDNLSRKPSGQAEADIVTVSTLGITIDKQYSLQRLELDAHLADHRYQTKDEKNFTALDYSAAWRWSLTPYFHGNLSSERTEVSNAESSDGAIVNPQSGTRTEEKHRLDGVLEVSGSWRVLGGVTQSVETYSETPGPVGDKRLNSAEAGLRYDFPSGSSFSYVARESRGDAYDQSGPKLGTLRFSQHEDELRLIWPITGKTTIDARAARLSRTYPDYGSRDYDGLIGNVKVNWHITGKTSLAAVVAREQRGYQSGNSRLVVDRFTLSPQWQISEKTTLRGRYDYALLDYRGGIDDHVDKQRMAQIALEWKALRTLTFSALLQHERRSTNEVKSTQAGIAAQLAF